MTAAGLPQIAPDGSITVPSAFNEWIKEEIESVSTAHLTRQVLDGIVAKRSDLNKSLRHHESEIKDIDKLPEDQRVRPCLQNLIPLFAVTICPHFFLLVCAPLMKGPMLGILMFPQIVPSRC